MVSMMNGDSFGLVLRSAIWVIPVKAIPAHRWIPLMWSRHISLLVIEKLKVMLALSLSLSLSLPLFPANLRQSCWAEINEEKNG